MVRSKRKGSARRKRTSVPDSARQPRARIAVPRGLTWTLGASVAIVGALAFALLIVFPAGHGPGQGRDVELDIPGGESADALAARLAAAGLTDSPRLFALYLRATGGAGQVVRGAHLLTDDLSPRDVVARLERSISAGRVRITIPEGWNRFDVARRLQDKHVCILRRWLEATTSKELLAELSIDGPSAEGFLFPATYDFAPDSEPADVVRRMKVEFDKRYATLEDRHQAGILDLSRSLGWQKRDIVTLASMVEKEAVVDEERPIIASVFVNRLRDPSFTPKILQCDPTAGYGCLVVPELAPSCAGYTGKITHDIVADASNPYNTYKHDGLPPGPIANPGARSLEAAMDPATTHYFYFVARGEGRHTFSETYAGHAAAVHAPKGGATRDAEGDAGTR